MRFCPKYKKYQSLTKTMKMTSAFAISNKKCYTEKAMGRKGEYTLKNRKKLLALMLGMSLAVTFPVQAAGVDASSDISVKKDIQPTETQDTATGDTGADTDPDQKGDASWGGQDKITSETEAQTEQSETRQTENAPTDPEVIMDKKMPETEMPEINSETVITEKETEGTQSEAAEKIGQKLDSRFKELEIMPEELKPSFRFETVDKVYAVAKKDIRIYTEKNPDSKVAGTLEEGGLCYVLEAGETWYYVESGEVRGFVKKKYLLTGKTAKKQVKDRKKAEMPLTEAKSSLDPSENPAYTYTKTTVRETLVKRVYGIAAENELNIREEKTTDARVVGVIPADGLCCILADKDEEWCYVESGNVRGFVKSELLLTGNEAKKIVRASGRKNMQLAQEKIVPEDNKALYYTITSTEKAYAEKGKYLGKFKLTAYCACPICCGAYANGITASGTVPVQGQTVAMYGVPFGTKLVVGDTVYTVEDRGTPYGHIDIYMVNHEDAAAFGVQEAEVYLAK